MGQKYKIALVSVFPDDPDLIVGGVAGVTVYLARALQDQYEPEMHVICENSSSLDHTERWNGITVHRLGKSRLPGFLSYWTDFRKKLHAALKKIRPDITHFQGNAGWMLGYNAPCVLTIHGINEKDVLYKGGFLSGIRSRVVAMIETQGRRYSQNTILINPYVREELNRDIRGKTWLIENPVSEPFFLVNRKNENPIILFAGAIIPRKNVMGLIKGFHELLRKGIKAELRLAGPFADKSYAETCTSYTTREKIAEHVAFLGPLNGELMRNELQRATCLALVSHQETAPLVVGEAMAAGVPVIACRSCGLPWMIQEGVTGYLINPDSPEEIANRLELLISDQNLNELMSDNCRQTAKDRFHVDSVTKRTMTVYEEIIRDWAPKYSNS